MKKVLACALIIGQLALISAFFQPATVASAAPVTQTAYQGLDVLFLVDQSGSMGGALFNSPGGPAANDPLGLRFQAVQYAFQTLNDYTALVPATTTFQMGVINFGDTSEVALPWTTIQPGAADWSQKQASVLNQLSQQTFGYRNLGYTNFVVAYQQAQNMIDNLPPLSNGAKHLHAIIVLTDGAPCVPTQFRDKTCNDPSDWTQHMAQVSQLTAQAFPAPDTRLYTIALTDQYTFWPKLQPAWEQIVGTSGSVQRIQRSTEVGPSFLKILLSLVQSVRPQNSTQDLIGQQLAINGTAADVAVPPYHKSMRVTLFKTKPDAQISLTDPNGTHVSQASPQVQINGSASAIESWTVTDPAPGQWQVTVDKKEDILSAYVDLILDAWNLDVPAKTTTLQTAVPVTLQILNSQNQPLADYTDPRFALQVTAMVHLPDGKSQSIALAKSAAGTYIGSVTPEESGTYAVDVAASTQNLDGSALKVVDQVSASSFAVSGVTLDVSAPSTTSILQTQPLTLSAQVNDGPNKPISNAKVVAIVQGPSGTQNLPMTQQQDGSYSVSLPTDTAGQFKVDVQAVVAVNNSDPLTLNKSALPSLTVRPVSMARLNIVGPQNNITQYTTGGFPSFAAQPLTVRVVAVDSNSKPVDLAALAGGSVPLKLQVLGADNKPVSQTAQFTSAGNGLYDVTIPNLAAGQYKIVVQPDEAATMPAGTMFTADSKIETVTVNMATNPALLTTIAVAGVIGLSGVSASGAGLFFRRKRRLHPATGRIAILREDLSLQVPDRDTVWSLSLNGKHSNHIVITHLPSSLKRLTIECPDTALSKRGQVVVTLESKKRTIFKRVTLGRGSERVIDELTDGDTVYYLAKDFDELRA